MFGWAEKAEKVQGKGLPTSGGGRVGAGGGEASWCGVGRCGHDVCAHAHATSCVADEAREEALGCCVLLDVTGVSAVFVVGLRGGCVTSGGADQFASTGLSFSCGGPVLATSQ